MTAMIGAAQQGLGILRMPMPLGQTTPGLEFIPLIESQPYLDIWVVAHKDVWPTVKVQASISGSKTAFPPTPQRL